MSSNAHTDLGFSSRADALAVGLSLDTVQRHAPAVFASSAHERLSAKYTFIPTERVLSGLMQAGFVPVDARQARSRKATAIHSRHIVRLRRRFETVQLNDSVPEIVFLNSHDGSSAYHLRMGVFRVICTNGLIVSRGAFPAVCVAHRGDVVDEVIAGALQMAERFDMLVAEVERMERRLLADEERVRFAQAALTLRYPAVAESGMQPSQLLGVRRVEDAAPNLWATLNCVQENLLRGGLSRRAASGRLTRTRRITAIREEVRLNSGLWDIATELLAA